ncbi:MAG: Macrolide export ATP-binding/permease protein MacB [Candidatus Ordinivivax streblomastigis]|uniref:Macrolide export ATP-binding/permease protein MacB n=1 Tax=Candidatus Ordinivivax streblomastigis TaxID=2540710 RepID=A0A5M8P4U8_9BACT|nr:MAG: Macrolide export ATP-binding/permease protein MacB [Candidatus Ordinivivax streblomastigis]
MFFDIDNWAEIFSTLKKNKLRTFLTGFSISWGIFMFCILLSAGNGLKNGMMSNFGSRSVNSIQFWGRTTSMPYKGLSDGRRITIDEKDLDLLQNQVPEALSVSGIINANVSVSYKTFNTSCEFKGVVPDYKNINGIKIKDNQGRFINEIDMKDHRKVMVINQRIKEVLFQEDNPVGKQIIAGGLGYTVIGVFEEDSWGNDEKAYIPFSTAQLLYNKGWGINEIAFTVKDLDTKEDDEAFEEQLRNKLSVLHTFDPEDTRSIGIWNQLENYLQTVGIFNGLSLFIWVIGVGTLIAGIVSVSNIMLITVRERTREFGIRKALGAKPSSILGSILMESIFITSLFGYIGMFLGIGLGELVNSGLKNADSPELSHIFQNPTVEIGVAVGAMCVLIISGVVAGYFPALKAVRISPVEAMKEE